jgi:hypothetical protein
MRVLGPFQTPVRLVGSVQIWGSLARYRAIRSPIFFDLIKEPGRLSRGILRGYYRAYDSSFAAGLWVHTTIE